MIRFKHKKSGDTIEVARVRTYINDDGSKYSIDLSSKYDLTILVSIALKHLTTDYEKN